MLFPQRRKLPLPSPVGIAGGDRRNSIHSSIWESDFGPPRDPLPMGFVGPSLAFQGSRVARGRHHIHHADAEMGLGQDLTTRGPQVSVLISLYQVGHPKSSQLLRSFTPAPPLFLGHPE